MSLSLCRVSSEYIQMFMSSIVRPSASSVSSCASHVTVRMCELNILLLMSINLLGSTLPPPKGEFPKFCLDS